MKKKVMALSTLALASSIAFAGLASAASGFVATGFPTLQQGASGGFVRGLQAALYSYGQAGNVGSIDGAFGSGTRTGVINMQGNIGVTADGVVGSGTWTKLDYYALYDTSNAWTIHTPYSTTYETQFAHLNNSVKYYVKKKNGFGETYFQGTVY